MSEPRIGKASESWRWKDDNRALEFYCSVDGEVQITLRIDDTREVGVLSPEEAHELIGILSRALERQREGGLP
jgi:hypothetical protein